MMRKSLLWLSEQPRVFQFVRRNGLARSFASRFVAGEEATTAVQAAQKLNTHGITASLDLLGESVTRDTEAAAARDEYLRMLDLIAGAKVQANVSVKLTQMGFDISEDLCHANITRILDRALELKTFVRLDMESSAYTQRTLDFFANRLFDRYGRRHRGGDPVLPPPLGRGHRPPDRNAGPGPALQGRLPRAGRRSPFPTRPTWTGTT